MTIGISKERLETLLNYTGYITANDLLRVLTNECTELNPWLPIEQAPKDRPVLLYISAGPITCRQFVGNAYDSWAWQPTHYQELPGDPK